MTYPFGRPGGLSWALNASSSARGATLFSGFEGVGLGMKAAGITHAWGIELEDDIAAVSRANGFDVLTADILQCDPKDFEQVDFLHASPPCPNFSNAKANGEETAADIALAEKVAEFIAVLLPTFFTLENVYQYRNSQSWETIARALLTHGYQFNYWHVNTADYGVPQTRKRMIVIARRDGIKPMLPPATHAENPVNGLFGKLGKWVGWYEAIEDLIPALPESKFAKWQLARLPNELKDTLIVGCTSSGFDRAEIMKGVSKKTNPMSTITAEPSGGLPRAFIVDGKLSGTGEKKLQINQQGTPSGTVVASMSAMKDSKAFLYAGDANSREEPDIQYKSEPTNTLRAHSSTHRAMINGRVVQMTPRALARFQSFPDCYELPKQKRLACKGIGNAVPPLFMQRLYEGLL